MNYKCHISIAKILQLLVTIDFHRMKNSTVEVNGDPFGYQHFSFVKEIQLE